MSIQRRLLRFSSAIYCVLILATTLIICTKVHSQERKWVQPVDGVWSDASKWSSGIPPSSFSTVIRFTPPPPVGGGRTGVPNNYTSTNDLFPNPFQMLYLEITGYNSSPTNSPVVVTVNSPTPLQIRHRVSFTGSPGNLPLQTFTGVLNADISIPNVSTDIELQSYFGNTGYVTGSLSEEGGSKALFIRTDTESRLILQGANQLTDRTVLDGNLTIDFSNDNTKKLSDSGPLVLAGILANTRAVNSLHIIGNSNADSVQNLPGCEVPLAGESTFSVMGSGGFSSTLNLGTISRDSTDRGILIFQPGTGSQISTTNPNSNNILGGWALFGNGDDFARVESNNHITFANYDIQNNASLFVTNQNISNTGPFTNSAPTVTINSLRIANDTDLNIGPSNTLTLASGGLLMTSNTNQVAISGGTLTSNSGELLVHLRSNGKMLINSSITGSMDLIKYGPGTLELAGEVSLNGMIGVHQGILLTNSNQITLDRYVVINPSSELHGNGRIVFPNFTGQVNSGVRVYGTISPGDSSINHGIGKLAIDWPTSNVFALSILEGGHYQWQLGALRDNETGIMGIDWDGISITAGGYSMFSYTIHLAFVGSANAPSSSDPFWQTSHTWTIIDNETAGIGGFLGNIENANYGFGAFTAIPGVNNDLLLRWTVVSVPELHSVLLLASSCLICIGFFWTIRKARKNRYQRL